MPRRYKLRLGDGTVLVVDQAGLNTWQVDDKAMVQAAKGQWRPLKEILAVQRAAAKYASQQASSPRAALPLIPPPPKPREDSLPRVPAARSWADMAEPPSIGNPAGVTALAEEPTGPSDEYTRRESTADEGLPIIPSTPLDEEDAAPRLPETFSQSEPLGLSMSEPPELHAGVDEPAIASMESLSRPPPPDDEVGAIPPNPPDDKAPGRPEPPWWRDSMEPPPITERPSLQVVADDVAPRDGYTGQTSTPNDGLPTISLKPLDDRDEAHAPAATGTGIYEGEQDDFLEGTPQGYVLDERLIRAVDAFGRFLSRALDRLFAPRRAAGYAPSAPEEPHPSVGVPPGVQVLAEEPAGPRGEDTRWGATAGEGLPIRLKPLESEGTPFRAAQNLLRRLGSRASAWAVGPKGWVDRLTRSFRPGPSGPSNEPAVSGAAYPASSELLKPPPPISELPVLRLADIDEPKEAEDIYEDEGESLFHVAWLWTQRIVLITGLVAGGILAAITWEAWFPKAAHLAGVAVNETYSYMRSMEQRERERRALQEATEQLPHLAPETIRLVLSRSPTGVLDPPEAFQRASDAADRGLSTLSPPEAQELKALRNMLLDTLSPAEGERVREYDRARARRATFAFEDRSALELFARGARALPSESRERLQALLGEEIAAGLPRPTEVAPGAAAER